MEFESMNAAVKGQCVKPLHQLAKMVGLNGLEPSTSRLSGVRSNQLSYRPIWVYKDFCERIESFKTKHNR